jgi:ferric-dicitrate binding protein FerR (iron transport regulator)
MIPSSLEELFNKYYNQTATESEKAMLFTMINETRDQELLELIQNAGTNLQADGSAAPGKTAIPFTVMAKEKAENMVNQILEGARREEEGEGKIEREGETERVTDETGNKRVIPIWMKYAAAVVLVFAVAGLIYFTKSSNSEITTSDSVTSLNNDIAPGGNKAILTLSDGTKIILDNAADGNLSTQGNSKVIKLDDGQLAYQKNGQAGDIAYNTITTPNGGQYHIILSDGSKVWLNAASSLRYPTSFSNNERTVELTGEGYFDIAHNASQPFTVIVQGTKVEVLGTQFNINAYADEPVLTTTLIEGKVKLNNKGTLSLLKPGQQALISGPGQTKVSSQADIEEAIAWKNGKFIFNGNRITAIMRQLARWYDIQVEYNNSLPDDEFVGAIRRSENISAILRILSKTKTVRFAIDGKKVTVLPY